MACVLQLVAEASDRTQEAPKQYHIVDDKDPYFRMGACMVLGILNLVMVIPLDYVPSVIILTG